MYALIASLVFVGILITFVYEKSRHRGILVDTSALIDGRLVEIVNLGFISEKLIVPELVEMEIEKLGKSSDSRVAAKALTAKKNLSRLSENKNSLLIKKFKADHGKKVLVDDELIDLAAKHRLGLISTDSELLTNASKRGLKTLNVNELALALRLSVQPGQNVVVKLLFNGRQATQAVGYLEDGTMVVVSGGAKFIGKSKIVEVKKVLQTSSGRTVIASVRDQS